MDAIPVITLILTIVGFIIICYFTFKVRDETNTNIENTNIENHIKRLNQTISDADALVNLLDNFSKNIKQDLNTRYDEVLYLYTMVNDKKTEVLELINKKEPRLDVSKQGQAAVLKEYLLDNKINKTDDYIQNNIEEFVASESNLVYQKLDNLSRNEEIITLFDKGFPMAEIAKKLNIGFGEVKLIVDLNRRQAVLWLIKEVILLG